jgi:hypothetical protein
MGVGKEHKLDLEEFFDDIGVSDREVMICKKIIVNSLSIQQLSSRCAKYSCRPASKTFKVTIVPSPRSLPSMAKKRLTKQLRG